MLCIAAGLVAALGVYADGAGPVGEAFADGIGVVVGRLVYVVPPALLVIGALLVRGPREEGVTRTVKPIVGAVFVLLAATGLLHLIGDRPDWDAGSQALIDAGGYLGVAIGGSLQQVLGVWGSGFVMLAVLVIGLVLLTGTTVRSVAARAGDASRSVGEWVRGLFAGLFRVGPTDQTIDLRDETAAADAEDVPKKRRRGKTDAAGAEPEADPSTQDVEPEVVVAGADLFDQGDAPIEEIEADEFGLPVPTEDEAVATEQLEIDLGPAAERPVWKLPGRKLLERSEAHEVDRQLVEEKGARSRARSPSTASRPASSAWWSVRPSPATSSSSARA